MRHTTLSGELINRVIALSIWVIWELSKDKGDKLTSPRTNSNSLHQLREGADQCRAPGSFFPRREWKQLSGRETTHSHLREHYPRLRAQGAYTQKPQTLSFAALLKVKETHLHLHWVRNQVAFIGWGPEHGLRSTSRGALGAHRLLSETSSWTTSWAGLRDMWNGIYVKILVPFPDVSHV